MAKVDWLAYPSATVPPRRPPSTAVAVDEWPRCTGCDQPALYVVPAYWDPAAALCSSCCAKQARWHDQSDEPWPPGHLGAFTADQIDRYTTPGRRAA